MKKLILLPSSPIQNTDDFLSLIFFKSRKQKERAKLLFELLIRGELTTRSYRFIPKKLGMSQPEYYNILKRFKDLGIIDVVNERYLISNRFIQYLKYLESFVANLKQ